MLCSCSVVGGRAYGAFYSVETLRRKLLFGPQQQGRGGWGGGGCVNTHRVEPR